MAWNRPDENQVKKRGDGRQRDGSRSHGFIAAALVVVGAAVAWCLLSKSSNQAIEEPKKPKEQIKEVAVVAARREAPRASTNVVARKRIGLKARGKPDKTANIKPPTIMTDEQLRYKKNYEKFFGKQIFTHGTDNIICGIITARPGTTFLPIDIGAQFEADFKESLDDPIRILESDTSEEKELKNEVIAARKYLEEAMGRGESPAQLVREAREEIEKVTRYRNQLNDNLMLLLKGGSEEDVKLYLDESNRFLSEYDAIPLAVSPLSWKRLRQRLEDEASGAPRQIPKL